MVNTQSHLLQGVEIDPLIRIYNSFYRKNFKKTKKDPARELVFIECSVFVFTAPRQKRKRPRRQNDAPMHGLPTQKSM